jgi:hypothetical protein
MAQFESAANNPDHFAEIGATTDGFEQKEAQEAKGGKRVPSQSAGNSWRPPILGRPPQYRNGGAFGGGSASGNSGSGGSVSLGIGGRRSPLQARCGGEGEGDGFAEAGATITSSVGT